MDATRLGMRPAFRKSGRPAGRALFLLGLAVLAGIVLDCATGGRAADAQTRTVQIDAADGLVTVRLASAPLKDVAKALQDKTGLSVVLDDRVADATVTASFDRLPLRQAVETIFEPFSTVVTYDRNKKIRGVFVMEGGAAGPQTGPPPGGVVVPLPAPAPPFVPPAVPAPAVPEPLPEVQPPSPGQEHPAPQEAPAPAPGQEAPQPGQEPQVPPPAALGGPVPEGQAGPSMPLPPAVTPQIPGQTPDKAPGQ
jgi:hypothetical protein